MCRHNTGLSLEFGAFFKLVRFKGQCWQSKNAFLWHKDWTENAPLPPQKTPKHCYPDASVSCISHSLQQPVILWIKGDGEGTVYYST